MLYSEIRKANHKTIEALEKMEANTKDQTHKKLFNIITHLWKLIGYTSDYHEASTLNHIETRELLSRIIDINTKSERQRRQDYEYIQKTLEKHGEDIKSRKDILLWIDEYMKRAGAI